VDRSGQGCEGSAVSAFPATFPSWAGSDSLLAEMLARDTALGPDHQALNVDQADRRILLEKLADAYQELDEALNLLETSDA
jgi:uncharacterized protein YukE